MGSAAEGWDRRRAAAFAFEEVDDASEEEPPDAGWYTGRFSPYALSQREHVGLEATLDWCRDHATRVELWIGGLGAFSAGQFKAGKLPQWAGAPVSLERRRPPGYEWLDRTPDAPPKPWIVRGWATFTGTSDAEVRRAGGRAVTQALRALSGSSRAHWSTDPDLPNDFRFRVRLSAPTHHGAERQVADAVRSVLGATWWVSTETRPCD
jgi:hypothetical protein